MQKASAQSLGTMLRANALLANALLASALLANVSLAAFLSFAPSASQAAEAWLDARRTPDERATLALAAMTFEEKIRLLHGPTPLDFKQPDHRAPGLPQAIAAAGFVRGVPRLGIANLYETDASLGIANPGDARPGDVATALPAGLALAATFDPALAYRAGAMVGEEAHAKGFNVLLGGGMDLTRDPRNGRNFEYLGEDPLLAGVLAAAAVRGVQDQHVISTVKHFALNANETHRWNLDARIERAALRESDLFAFEIAIEGGSPGAVMCAYNQVNGAYSCANDWLLNEVLKHDWAYRGWVMSDWGAVHGVDAALAGLDQESGEQMDASVWFDRPLEEAVRAGTVPASRIDSMAHRILRSMFAVGVIDHPPIEAPIDYHAHAALALEIARKGLVLLKNRDALLPLGAAHIAVIGGYANLGVLSGGGSAQVLPSNGSFIRIPAGSHGEALEGRSQIFDPSAPTQAMRRASPTSTIDFDPGLFPAAAAVLASHADVAIVFATRHELEGYDIPDLELPQGQDALIEAVAAANPHTIVVLETGNPVAMPWLDRVAAVIAAWYPGQEGGQAIADVLFGAVDPSGRLPMSFPRRIEDFVRPTLPNLGVPGHDAAQVDYSEGARVGYRWYAAEGKLPLFAFGFGLSYTRFDYDGLTVTGGKTLNVSFTVHNRGPRAGADVPQAYLTRAGGTDVLRLIGFQRVELEPGESRRVTLGADRRLLGSFDEAARRWIVKRGTYRVRIGSSAGAGALEGEAVIGAARVLP